MSGQRPAESSSHRAVLHVFQRDDGDWGWCYEEPDIGLELRSNDHYPTREEATESARRVYPDVPLFPEAGPVRRPRGR